MGKDVLSPPCHRAFSDPKGMLKFVAQCRELAGGNPSADHIAAKLGISRRSLHRRHTLRKTSFSWLFLLFIGFYEIIKI